MIWIAVDAMGGDHAPRHVVDGALTAVRHFDLGVQLVGRTSLVEPEVARFPDIDWPAPLHVPPPWEGGDGKAINEKGKVKREKEKVRQGAEAVRS